MVVGRLSLIEFYAGGVLRQVIKKSLLGGAKIEMAAGLMANAELFAMGAVLGRAKADSMDTVIGHFVTEPGAVPGMREFLNQRCAERLSKYGRQPDSVHDYILSTELAQFWRGWKGSVDDFWASKDARSSTSNYIEVMQLASLVFAEGIVFGAQYPEQTHKLVTDMVSRLQPLWADAAKHGLVIRQQPDFQSFDDYETGVLALYEEYIQGRY